MGAGRSADVVSAKLSGLLNCGVPVHHVAREAAPFRCAPGPSRHSVPGGRGVGAAESVLALACATIRASSGTVASAAVESRGVPARTMVLAVSACECSPGTYAPGMSRVPIPAPQESASGMTRSDEPSLIQQVVDEFCPRFMPSGEVWYVRRPGEQSAVVDEENYRVSDIDLEPDSKTPDVIVKHATENWILFIEAVTSDRPLDGMDHDSPAVSAGADSLLPVYLAAFADRAAFRRSAMDIPWGTHVWVAAEPDHLVHFGGSQLLGPYN